MPITDLERLQELLEQCNNNHLLIDLVPLNERQELTDLIVKFLIMQSVPWKMLRASWYRWYQEARSEQQGAA